MGVSTRHVQRPFFFRKSFLQCLSVVFGSLLIFYYLHRLTTPQTFPITQVNIEGAHHINHDMLQRILFPLVDKGFFSIDIQAIQERLFSLPWIANVSVRRIWPDQVQIILVEKKPIARWNNGLLLSANGDLFSMNLKTQDEIHSLPQFIGPDGQQMEVLKTYTLLASALKKIDSSMTRFAFTPSQSWEITLSNGIKLIIDNQDVLTHINYFVKVYSKIDKNRLENIDYIDLRYSNGFAIHWK